MPYRIIKFDITDTASRFVQIVEDCFKDKNVFVVAQNRQTSATATHRARVWPEKYIILSRYDYETFPETTYSFSEILENYANSEKEERSPYPTRIEDTLEPHYEYAVMVLEMDKMEARVVRMLFDDPLDNALKINNPIDYANHLLVQAAALNDEGVKVLYDLFSHLVMIYPHTGLTLLPEMEPEYYESEAIQHHEPVLWSRSQEPEKDNQVKRKELDKRWYFNEGASVFMGLAQDYFTGQGAIFKLRREYNPIDRAIIEGFGEDILDVNERALLSFPQGESGARQVWVNTIKRPIGCKITITEINQGWIYIEQRWNEFVDYLLDDGWKIDTEKPEPSKKPEINIDHISDEAKGGDKPVRELSKIYKVQRKTIVLWKKILDCLEEGMSDDDIAEKLNISSRNVRHHKKLMKDKGFAEI